MTFRFRTIAVAAALASLGQPLAAQSSACVQPEDLADTVTYAMPLFLQGLQSKCATALPADSFILSQGESFAQSFEPLRDEAWPGARRTLMRFIESEAAAAEDSEGADATTAGFVQILSEKRFTNRTTDHALVLRLYRNFLTDALGQARPSLVGTPRSCSPHRTPLAQE